MKGDDVVRHCGACDRNVYDLSRMTSGEVRALFNCESGQACLRFYTRADGTVMTSDCPVGLRKLKLELLAGWATVLTLAFGAAVWVAQWGGLPKTATTLSAWIPRHKPAPAPIVTAPVSGQTMGVSFAQNNAY
jgi:hypothetical protein